MTDTIIRKATDLLSRPLETFRKSREEILSIIRYYLAFLMVNAALTALVSLAGYVDTKSGKRLIFAVYVNNVPFSDTNDMMTVGDDLGNITGLIYKDF